MNDSASDVVVDVRDLSKAFDGRTVVDRISLRVRRGRIFGFLGPNGSGKTTTIRMLCGLLTPDGGRGTCLGHDLLTEAHAIKSRVGYMTQRFSLYEDLSIRENLDFVARLYAVPGRLVAVERALADLGLSSSRDRLAGELSDGWKQRLALAACLLHAPRLLLLDEPTAGVDPKARREFWDHLHRLAAEGLTVLVSTHYMDEAERCHELAYIANGVLLIQGTATEVVQRSGLVTWAVTGPDLAALSAELRVLAGVDMVVPFGTGLHVSGADPRVLAASLAPYLADPSFRWSPAAPSLEDAFVKLTAAAPEAGGR